MDCRQAQDEILESFDRDGTAGAGSEIAAHLAECPACAEFAAKQQSLDARLGAALIAPELSPAFRPALRSRIRREKARAAVDSLPEKAHFLSCLIATLLSAILLPFRPSTVLAAGATATVLTYLVLSAARILLEEAEDWEE